VNGLTALRNRLTGGRDASDERGLSLSELLVAMMLLSLLMVMVVGFFATGSKAFNSNKAVDANTKSASNAMNEISRTLRAASENPLGNNVVASTFVSATSTSVVFYAYVNLDSATETPVQIRFAIDSNNNLVETEWAATSSSSGLWTFPATTAAPKLSRIIAGPILPVSAGGPALFSYLDVNGAVVAFSGGSIPAATARTIAAVDVSLAVGKSSATGQYVEIDNTVGLPNLPLARTQ
jgi:prepilin-type N-terminal cleavage/methylation domain-containing protein